MAEHWAAAMASTMQGLAGGSGSGQGLLFARISSTSPLIIQVNGQAISRTSCNRRKAQSCPSSGSMLMILKTTACC